MARAPFTAQDLQEIHDLAAQWGKIVARRAFGEQGPGTDVDLTAMEEVALVAAAGLTEGTLATLLEQQAQTLDAHQPCPSCGQLCPVFRETRPLDVRGGSLQLSEPTCHCPDCRRDFFPPPDSTRPGQPQL
jgi:hypothetical protein